MSFTKRTCVECGWRGPQPEMVQRQRRVEVARSRSTVSGSTVFGAVLGDKKSKRRVADSLFNNNQRTYTRSVTSWYCRSCAGADAEPADFGPIHKFLGVVCTCSALVIAKVSMLLIMSQELDPASEAARRLGFLAAEAGGLESSAAGSASTSGTSSSHAEGTDAPARVNTVGDRQSRSDQARAGIPAPAQDDPRSAASTVAMSTAAVAPAPEAAGPTPAAAGPSFDCRLAERPSEFAICETPELAAIDMQISAAFQAARASTPGDVAREFARALLEERYACGSDVACLQAEMRRSEYLLGEVARFDQKDVERSFRELPRDRRISVQRSLASQGLYAGGLDGAWGAQTSAAVYGHLVAELQTHGSIERYADPRAALSRLAGGGER